MLGERSDQRGLWEADRLYLDHVGRDTFYGVMASLRGRLFRADADTAERMDRVVEVVRSSHQGECGSGWRPVAVDPGPWGACFGAPGERGPLVGDVPVPPGLIEGRSARWASGRDSSNNVLVYWSEDSLERPSGGAGCWLFDSSARIWSANRGLAGTFPFSLPRLGVWEPPVAPASGS